MRTIVIIEAIAIALLGFIVLGLLRSHALILKALHDLGAGLELETSAKTASATTGSQKSEGSGPVPVQLETGVVPERAASSRAHPIVGTDLNGSERTLDSVRGGGRILLAFLTTGCSVCQTFWEEFTATTPMPGGADLVIVAKGSADESPAVLRRLAAPGVTVIQSSAAWVDYDIPGSPYFVYVEGDQVTGEGSATTWPQVRDLMAQAVEEAADARNAAGRSGPGALVGLGVKDVLSRGERDNPSRIDAELRAAGITPEHPSLYEPGAIAPHEK